jgi:hypothetical protein
LGFAAEHLSKRRVRASGADTGYPPFAGSGVAVDMQDGSNDRPSVQWKVEGHGRIAGCCVDLRQRRHRQHLAVLLMAFAPSQKQ